MKSLKDELEYKLNTMLEDMFFCQDNADEVPTLRGLLGKIEERGIHGSRFTEPEISWLKEILHDIEDIWGLKKSLKAAYIHLGFAVPISKKAIAKKTVMPKTLKKYWFRYDKKFYDVA